MRDIQDKTNGSTELTAGEFNSIKTELQNLVESGGFTLDPEGGPDADTEMMAVTLANYCNAANSYVDSGFANIYVLDLATPNTYKEVSAYVDGMVVVFKATNTNTGAASINVNSIGAVNFTRPNLQSLKSGDIIAGNTYIAVYKPARFELINPTQDEVEVGSISKRAISDGLEVDEYLLCDGRAVSRTTYDELFAKIGTAYGAGDGSTTFNLPDIDPVVDGSYFEFDGVNDYLVAADDPNLDIGENSASFVVWFKTDGSTLSERAQFFQKRITIAEGYEFGINTNDNLRLQYDNGAETTYISTETYNDQEWHGWAISIDPESGFIYVNIDGVEDTPVAIAGSGSASNAAALYFLSSDGANEFFPGSQKSKFFNRALSETERIKFATNPEAIVDPADKGASQAEINTEANAIADAGGTEANATTGWTPNSLTGVGANVFQSQSSVVATGTYAFEGNCNDTPIGGARFLKDIHTDFSMIYGSRYRIKAKIRHVGTGGNWNCSLDSIGSFQSGNQTVLKTVTSGDTTFQQIEYEFIHSINTVYFGCRETSPTNDGGVYFDDFSLVKIGLIADWEVNFDDDTKMTDVSGNGNDAINNGATLIEDGVVNYIKAKSRS